MEAITRMVADSLARHGLDRPVDPRRLQWSRWFRCDSTHSLLVVPSKPGIFALAEEVMDLGAAHVGTDAFVRPAQTAHVGTAAPGCPAEQSSAAASAATTAEGCTDREGHDFSRAERTANSASALAAAGGAMLQRCDSLPGTNAASAAEPRRLLAVLQFSEDDDMAFTLDRMFTRINPMRDRLASGRCFLRFVVIEDQAQRRSICATLNQWMLSSAEKATGLPPDFSSSVEYVSRTPSSATHVGTDAFVRPAEQSSAAAAGANSNSIESTGTKTNVVSIDSGSARNLHCPHPLPSGF
jgi:hypothetical protein